MQMKRFLAPAFTFTLGILGFVAQGEAEIFRFVAPDGTIHFTNVPTDARYKRFVSPGATFSQFRRGSVSHRARLYRLIDDTAREYRVDPALIRAVVKAESDYDPGAVSSAGALGLMQLMPGTAEDLEVRNPLNPEENVRGGVQYLRYLLDRFQGNTTLALAAYHAGEQNVDRHGGVPPIEATQHYVKRVMAYHTKYRNSMPKPRKEIYRVVLGDSVLYTSHPQDLTR